MRYVIKNSRGEYLRMEPTCGWVSLADAYRWDTAYPTYWASKMGGRVVKLVPRKAKAPISPAEAYWEKECDKARAELEAFKNRDLEERAKAAYLSYRGKGTPPFEVLGEADKEDWRNVACASAYIDTERVQELEKERDDAIAECHRLVKSYRNRDLEERAKAAQDAYCSTENGPEFWLTIARAATGKPERVVVNIARDEKALTVYARAYNEALHSQWETFSPAYQEACVEAMRYVIDAVISYPPNVEGAKSAMDMPPMPASVFQSGTEPPAQAQSTQARLEAATFSANAFGRLLAIDESDEAIEAYAKAAFLTRTATVLDCDDEFLWTDFDRKPLWYRIVRAAIDAIKERAGR